ncbi:hypothetical protein C0971_10085 [Bacillus methanolicus]|uniref:hypothetical protein n=1 Tax=Bacillus methanolicus TaxID=1471 RepID=UPI00200F0F57|nr:hypothetical protein [Bacillus methanolicus]UQD52321.1 hypothetical protein C0971_10085 [Bacillus methanolicus]
MRQRLILTQKEYDELQRLMRIVKDKNNLPGKRRLAMAKFDQLYNQALKRNANHNNNNGSSLVANR